MSNTNSNDNSMENVLKLVIVLSGKRKSGKDHISTLLRDYIGSSFAGAGNQLAVLRIAEPIKKEFANNNNLDFDRLLGSTQYKETYRRAMVDWSERYRAQKGWDCFLKQAIEEQGGHERPIWILNDARRPCDVDYFELNNSIFSRACIMKLRVVSSEEVRSRRGWQFVEGIDDRETECGLDNYDKWTLVIENNSQEDEYLLRQLRPVFEAIDDALGDLRQPTLCRPAKEINAE